MTVDVPGSGGDVTVYDPTGFDENIGLEDTDASDIVIPRLQIQHTESLFKDNLSGATYSSLDVILLGQIKQRIMWEEQTDDNDKPLCKSPDYVHGFPNVSELIPVSKRFPWDESNFNPSDTQMVSLAAGQDRRFPEGYTSNGLPTLTCDACAFNDWTKNPKTGKNVPPRCSEQHTFPLLYSPDEGSTWIAALLTLQRTGLKPSKQYISSFAQTKTPMFTVYTRLSLQSQSRGTVIYSVPVLSRGGSTDRKDWEQYGEQYRSIRKYVRSAPRPADDGSTVTAPSANVNTAPVAAPAAPVATANIATATNISKPAVAPVTAPAVPVEDDDLPF